MAAYTLSLIPPSIQLFIGGMSLVPSLPPDWDAEIWDEPLQMAFIWTDFSLIAYTHDMASQVVETWTLGGDDAFTDQHF